MRRLNCFMVLLILISFGCCLDISFKDIKVFSGTMGRRIKDHSWRKMEIEMTKGEVLGILDVPIDKTVVLTNESFDYEFLGI